MPMATYRTWRIWAGCALASATLLSAAGCGSTSGTALGADEGTAPADCSALATKFGAAVTSFGKSDSPDASALFTELTKVLPNDLKDNAKVLQTTFGSFATVLHQHSDDMAAALADPAGRAAITAMGSEKAAAANAAIEHYFATICTN